MLTDFIEFALQSIKGFLITTEDSKGTFLQSWCWQQISSWPGHFEYSLQNNNIILDNCEWIGLGVLTITSPSLHAYSGTHLYRLFFVRITHSCISKTTNCSLNCEFSARKLQVQYILCTSNCSKCHRNNLMYKTQYDHTFNAHCCTFYQAFLQAQNQ